MKLYKLFIIILICITSKIYCQKSKIKLDKDYFVIGTLNDEMGRKKAFHDNETVEESRYSRVIMKYNFNLLKNEYNDLVIDSTNHKSEYPDNLNIVLKSKKFASKIIPLYTYRDDLEIKEDENSEIIDSIYTAALKPNIFKNKLQRISFITGVYCVNGVRNESKYCIQFVNSIGKYSVCVDVLKKLGCKNVELIVIEAIPCTETIYFEPSEKLKTYFNEYEFIRKKVKEEKEEISKKINAYYKSIEVK